MYLVTTSHRPSQRMRSFVKDLASVLPGAVRVNRGKSTLYDLLLEAVERRLVRVLVVGGKRGNPSLVRVYRVVAAPGEERLEPLVSLVLGGVTLTRELRSFSRVYNPRTLGIQVPRGPENLEHLADALYRALKARLVLDESRLDQYDIVIRVRRGEKGFLVFFMSPATGRPCGPILRVSRLVDHEKGLRVPGAGGRGGEAGGT